MIEIKTSNILKLDELQKYKLHLASISPNGTRPLDVFVRNWDEWVGWNEWRGGKGGIDRFNKPYIFSLIKFYPEANKYLFGGIFEVVERFLNWKETERGYQVKLVPLHQELIGRLIINFYRKQGLMGSSFLLKSHYDDFSVSQILKKAYDGVVFPGYESIRIDFNNLEQIYAIQKSDWKVALENVKGVYVIVDKSNGKKYVGSAYGDFGIWSRWACYIGTGHGWNDELTHLIKLSGKEYAKNNFQFTLLEYRSMKTDDKVIIERETFWKEALITRSSFGYNKN